MVRGGEVCGVRDGKGRFRILLRSDRRPIRVAVTSGEGDLDRLSRVGAPGPEALIRKPIDLDELIRSLKTPAPRLSLIRKGPFVHDC
jgi:hypothetical protein